jgi:hypothetical protein
VPRNEWNHVFKIMGNLGMAEAVDDCTVNGQQSQSHLL